MPRGEPPKLRKHARGYWFCRWGGRDHYLHRDRDIAQDLYLNDKNHGLPAWSQWLSDQRAARVEQKRRAEVLTLTQLRDRFLENRELESGPDTEAFYRKHTRRFDLSYGGFYAGHASAQMLQLLKDEMLRQRYAPRTINHDLQAVKTMLSWAMDCGLVPLVRLRAVRKLAVGPVENKAWSRSRVKAFIEAAPEHMRPWLAVQYLTAARPMEMVRLARDQGEWVERGVYALRNKAERNVTIRRHLLFSRVAFAWWRRIEPHWTRLDSYSAAVRRVLEHGPHPLRHSAATHLLQAGLLRDDADAILGHYPRRVSATYMLPQWQHLRRQVRVLVATLD
jgi:integrase